MVSTPDVLLPSGVPLESTPKRNAMKPVACLSLLLACSPIAFAAEPRPNPKLQTGRISTVQLLATGRVSAQTAPDGMRFLFLVRPAQGMSGNLALKETRDFLIAGKSYQEKSQGELGHRVEPSTTVDSPETFFAKQPAARKMAPADISNAHILTIAIPGAPLTPGTDGEVTVTVGFNEQVEPFTFPFTVAPAAPMARGVPPTPAEGHVRYVATEGVGFAPWTFDLKITEAAVSGAIFQHRTDTNGASTNQIGPFEIFDGRVQGKTITFKARSTGGERLATFTGEISGDEIKFSRNVDVKPGKDPGLNGILGGQGAAKFVAKRVTGRSSE
jgi:hypothetical protein